MDVLCKMTEEEKKLVEAARRCAYDGECNNCSEKHKSMKDCVEDFANLILTLTKEEIIHCKDCEYWNKIECKATNPEGFIGICSQAKWMVGATGFCVYGKAKE